MIVLNHRGFMNVGYYDNSFLFVLYLLFYAENDCRCLGTIPDELIFYTSGNRGFLRYMRTLHKVVPYFDAFLHFFIASLQRKNIASGKRKSCVWP